MDKIREPEMETLTDEDMRNLVRSNPPGYMKALPNLGLIGVENVLQAGVNIALIPQLVLRAEEHGFYLEAISLRLQYIEFWLRSFWVARNPKHEMYGKNDKRTFGSILKDCIKLGLDSE